MDETFGDGKPIRATFPAAPGKGKPRREGGRVCEYPGCGTLLSTYNSSTTCWAHQAGEPVKSDRLSRGSPLSGGRAVLPAA